MRTRVNLESLFFDRNFSTVGPLPHRYRLNEEKTRGSNAKITDDRSAKLISSPGTFKRETHEMKFESFESSCKLIERISLRFGNFDVGSATGVKSRR